MTASDAAFELLCMLPKEPISFSTTDICTELRITTDGLNNLLSELRRALKIHPKLDNRTMTAKGKVSRFREVSICKKEWKKVQALALKWWSETYGE